MRNQMPMLLRVSATHVPQREAHTNPVGKISNERQQDVNHRISALDPLLYVSPDGRHRSRDRKGRCLKPHGCAHLCCLAVRDASARRTAVRVHHNLPRLTPFVGCSRPPYNGDGTYRRQDRQHQRSLLLGLDAPRARRNCALLRYPLGARIVEPTTGRFPVVQQPEHEKAVARGKICRTTILQESLALWW